GRAVLAAGPAGPGAGEGPRLRGDRRLGRGLRRGPVDRRRGDRPGRARPGDRGLAVRAVRVPAGRVPRHEGRRRAASAVRRSRRARRRRRDGHPDGASHVGGLSRVYVAHLSLTDFRSYPQVELPLDPGITALVGPNGQGKTNLVEAVGYVAT